MYKPSYRPLEFKDTDWSNSEQNSECLVLLVMSANKTGRPRVFQNARILQTVSTFCKSTLPPRRPTMIRRAGFGDMTMCRVMKFPLPYMKKFTIEFWMRPYAFTTSDDFFTFFTIGDFTLGYDDVFSMGFKDCSVSKTILINHHEVQTLFKDDYCGWLHFSISFHFNRDLDIGIAISRPANTPGKTITTVRRQTRRTNLGKSRPTEFILPCPAFGGGSYSDVRLWNDAFLVDGKTNENFLNFLLSRCQARLVGDEDFLIHYWPLDETKGCVARNICQDRRGSSKELLASFAQRFEEEDDDKSAREIEKYKLFLETTAANCEDTNAKFGLFKFGIFAHNKKEEFFLSKSVSAFVDTFGGEGATMFACSHIFRYPLNLLGGTHTKNRIGIRRVKQGVVKLSRKSTKSWSVEKTNPKHLKDSSWRVFCEEKVMTTIGLVTVKYVVDVDLAKCSRTIRYVKCGAVGPLDIPGISVSSICQVGYMDRTSLKVLRAMVPYESVPITKDSEGIFFEYCTTHKIKEEVSSRCPMIDADPKTMLRPVMGRPLNERNICADSSITSTRSDLIDTTSRDLMSWSFDFECAFY